MRISSTSALLLVLTTIVSPWSAVVGAVVGPVGTATECCCGNQLASGDCCTVIKLADDPPTCLVDSSTSPNCQFLELAVGSGETCPEGGYSCDSSIVCPSVPPGPTPTPAPTIELPFDLDSCSFPTDYGTVNSDETCQAACEKYGLYCSVQGSITVCGSNYMEHDNCRGEPQVECQCGNGFTSAQLLKNVCEDKTELPPLRCDEALGIVSDDTCKETCEAFNVYCGENSQGETECTSRYEMSDDYMTCYCGPEEQVLCGNYCTVTSAAQSANKMPVVLGMISSGVAIAAALLI
mmetsp:Transcript_2228/g.3755  ORF Transcript_2228/g.3755 Transcript_2228/m.3755 type:complete len:293 (-) Transcript_2228:215-1093(-)